MNSRFLRHLQLSLAVLDLLVLNAIFFISVLLFNAETLNTYIAYTYFGFFLTIAWLVVTAITNLYHEKYITIFELFAKRSLQTFMYFLVPVAFYLYFFQQFVISRFFIITIISSIPVGLLINRFLYLAIYQYFKKKDYLINKVVIIGYNSLSKKLVNYLQEDGINKEVVGFCEEFDNVRELSLYPILSNVNDVVETCKKYGATEIYSTIAPEQNPDIYKLISKADQSCIRFKVVPDLGFFINKKIHIDYLKEIPVISMRSEPLEDLGNRIKKRMFDIAFSFFVIVFILSWLIPLIALLIWIESGFPIFFIQQRPGRDVQGFPCIKFRSMRVNKEANVLQATKGDKRITKVGKFLRRTSLDELPQFINVFKGHMSIVGPRPHLFKQNDDYAELISHYMVRQFLKPGITGWAQVNGYRGETRTIEQMQPRIEHDIWYMENWSLWLDVKIIFLTVFNIIKGEENAY